ncbi:hypothetical protein D9756_011452 [Leucocoprinus leucothites]|uniref:Uncharacterized protein n=1 Tax=Leucocoprinus leucothites TaxID=201217 RepID=A0A8H5CMM8_9AGAR|nr:hypothetical protein D9756_011452 [Leucoagaricus leucothites]
MTVVVAIPPNCIPANPDIAGVGIRVTAYIQNVLCLVVAIWAVIRERGVTPQTSLRLVYTQMTGIILTTGALFLSAFIQSRNYGLSVYHAIIVLNLGWVNLASHILYSNIGMINRLFQSTESFSVDVNHRLGYRDPARRRFVTFGDIDPFSCPGSSPLFDSFLSVWMHVSMGLFAGFGLWFWATVDTFGSTNQCEPGLPIPIRILGHTYFSNSPATRGAFLSLYTIFGLGTVLGVFMNSMSLIKGIRSKEPAESTPSEGEKFTFAPLTTPLISPRARRVLYAYTIAVDIGFLVGIVVGTEWMVQEAASFVQPGESQWTYGQNISVFLLVPGILGILHDIIEMEKERAKKKVGGKQKPDIIERDGGLNRSLLRPERGGESEMDAEGKV